MIEQYCEICGSEFNGKYELKFCSYCYSNKLRFGKAPDKLTEDKDDGFVSRTDPLEFGVTEADKPIDETTVPEKTASDSEESGAEKFGSIDDAISYIFEEYGSEVVTKSKVFMNLLCDYAPTLHDERRLIGKALDAGVYYDIYVSGCNDEKSRTVEINKAIHKLETSHFMDRVQATRAVNLIASHIGWIELCNTESSPNCSNKTDSMPKKWDKIYFGHYPYYENGDDAPIEWEVLDVEDGKVLLWTTKCIDVQCYHSCREQRPGWEECELRHWLGEKFISAAFTEKEQSAINTYTSNTSKNPRSNRKNGVPTLDKVFIISNEQLEQYRLNRPQLVCEATPYAKAKGIYCDANSMQSSWWLRTPGYGVFSEMFVSNNGRRDELGNTVDYAHYGVRPAIWVKWSSIL